MKSEIAKIYGKRLRLRVCGLLYEGDDLLLVKHTLDSGSWWAPPGGGVEYGESIENALRREFLEETKLDVRVEKFAFGCEFIHDPLHAVELFFWTERIGGMLRSGLDPENQIIEEVRFLSLSERMALEINSLHSIFERAHTKADLQQLAGFYRI